LRALNRSVETLNSEILHCQDSQKMASHDVAS
jgi:hypothetical protein